MKQTFRPTPPYTTKAGVQIGLLYTKPNRYQVDYDSYLVQSALLPPPATGGFFARIGRLLKAYI
jgi:hypothetical protein